jgi:hypothetical protein
METTEYVRKPFAVSAVEVTLENFQEVAAWCNGTVEMMPTKVMGTTMQLPCIKVRGVGDAKNKEFIASLGFYVVELKGSFRTYKPAVFKEIFEQKRQSVYRSSQKDMVPVESLTVEIPEDESLQSSL